MSGRLFPLFALAWVAFALVWTRAGSLRTTGPARAPFALLAAAAARHDLDLYPESTAAGTGVPAQRSAPALSAALLLTPAFLSARAAATRAGPWPADGASPPFDVAAALATLLAVALGAAALARHLVVEGASPLRAFAVTLVAVGVSPLAPAALWHPAPAAALAFAFAALQLAARRRPTLPAGLHMMCAAAVCALEPRAWPLAVLAARDLLREDPEESLAANLACALAGALVLAPSVYVYLTKYQNTSVGLASPESLIPLVCAFVPALTVALDALARRALARGPVLALFALALLAIACNLAQGLEALAVETGRGPVAALARVVADPGSVSGVLAPGGSMLPVWFVAREAGLPPWAPALAVMLIGVLATFVALSVRGAWPVILAVGVTAGLGLGFAAREVERPAREHRLVFAGVAGRIGEDQLSFCWWPRAGVEATRVDLVAALEGSAGPPAGEVLADVVVVDASGRELRWPLRAGEELAPALTRPLLGPWGQAVDPYPRMVGRAVRYAPLAIGIGRSWLTSIALPLSMRVVEIRVERRHPAANVRLDGVWLAQSLRS